MRAVSVHAVAAAAGALRGAAGLMCNCTGSGPLARHQLKQRQAEDAGRLQQQKEEEPEEGADEPPP